MKLGTKRNAAAAIGLAALALIAAVVIAVVSSNGEEAAPTVDAQQLHTCLDKQGLAPGRLGADLSGSRLPELASRAEAGFPALGPAANQQLRALKLEGHIVALNVYVFADSDEAAQAEEAVPSRSGSGLVNAGVTEANVVWVYSGRGGVSTSPPLDALIKDCLS